MNSYRKTAIIVGTLFLTAMIASLLGGGLLESILNNPDYLKNISENTSTTITGVILELINGVAVICIAVMLFPILRKQNESMALGYVGFRFIEAIFCIVSAAIPLLLIKLSDEYLNNGTIENSDYNILGKLLIGARSVLAEILIPLFFGLGALLFYNLLYKSKIIPGFISVWGFIGGVLILILIFIKPGMIVNIVFVLPIILNEIFLGIWLIVKGFNPSVINN